MCLESDIRARLGKLPKKLSGVYDEIMSSIESRPGTDFGLATRALKWMLVSRRPLSPEELVTATELNPSSPSLDRPANDQSLQPVPQPSLDIELVVHICGGLILLDQELEVMRFAHLSVQEYLETRNNSWGIIDAQRFVSEACLWTLQCGPSSMSALYDYAGRNWFRHCRSYQDIALLRSTRDSNHTVDIPIDILNNFLGSFNYPATHFAEWIGWLEVRWVQYEHQNLINLISSQSLSPAFVAAVSGLGELVTWLWHSESAEMNIKNDRNESLLYLASRYGTAWIMGCVLARGVELDINEVGSSGTALSGAAYSGILENATLLLNLGADINIRFGGECDTALGEAVAGVNLEVATLLLDRGADTNLTFSGQYSTALGRAVVEGYLEKATLLLDRGADINLTTAGLCGTALAWAAAGGNLEMATLLLDRGADTNITFSGRYNDALGATACCGKLEMARLLLDRGADINLTSGGEYGTALACAAVEINLEMVLLFLDRAADPNLTFPNRYGTALGAAAWSGNLELATLLLDGGAGINITPGGLFGTALTVAAWWGKLEMAKHLLDRGANINITFNGELGTALGAAASEGELEIAKLLLDRGANPTLTNHLGQKSRDLAESKGHYEMVRLLDSYSAGKPDSNTNDTQTPRWSTEAPAN